METYDPAKIGKLLSWKGENFVYRYGEAEVIKFSKFGRLFKRGFNHRPEWDLEVAQRFFGDLLVPTRVAYSPDGRKALVQPFVNGRILLRSDLQDPDVRRQYSDILKRHDELLAAGYAPLDLAGALGLLRGRLDNLFLLEDGTLKIIDTLLIDPDGLGLVGALLKPIRSLAVWRQGTLTRKYGGS